MTLGEQILAQAAGRESVKVGDQVQITLDWILLNDAAAHTSIDAVGKTSIEPSKGKVAVFLDHDTPSGSEAVSLIQRKLINFAKAHDTIFYNGAGVGYQLMLDAHVQAKQVVAGCGQHIAVFGAIGALGIKVDPAAMAGALQTGGISVLVPQTVKIMLTGQLQSGVYAKDIILELIRTVGTEELAGNVLEFIGPAVQTLTLNDRITICNLVGKTNAVSAVMNLTESADWQECNANMQLDLSRIRPLIALPDSFDQIFEVSHLDNIPVNEVFVGGCSGGRIEDLRVAAGIVRGKKVARGVRLMVAPVTSAVYVQALREGLITDFIEAGAVVMNQGCSVCWGKSQGIIDTDEVLVSAGSYNYKGCAGAMTAKVYVASAAIAANSAVAGFITGPANN